TIDYNIKLFKDYYPALWAACESGNADEFTSAMPHIGDLNVRSKNGWTALVIAAFNGRRELVSRLVTEGADINRTNWRGTTPLMYALENYRRTGDASVFQLLLNAKADVGLVDNYGKTLAQYIGLKNCPELAEYLPQQAF